MSTSTQPVSCGFPGCPGTIQKAFCCHSCKQQRAHHACVNMYIHNQRLTEGGRKPEVLKEGGVETPQYFEGPPALHYCRIECLFHAHPSLKPWSGEPPQADSSAQQQQATTHPAANPQMISVPFGTPLFSSEAPVPASSPHPYHHSQRTLSPPETYPLLKLVPVCNFTTSICPAPMRTLADYPRPQENRPPVTKFTPQSPQAQPGLLMPPKVGSPEPPFGLQNNKKDGLCNVCYMNAVIQMLLHPFRKPNTDPVIIAIKKIHGHLLAEPPNGAAPEFDVKSVIERMEEDGVIKPSCRKETGVLSFAPDQQEDSHEFFVYLMQKFEDGSPPPSPSMPHHGFDWKSQGWRYCTSCDQCW